MKRLFIVLLLLAGCATVHNNDEAEVRAAMAGFMDALNNLDAARISAAFADDATAFFPIAAARRSTRSSAATSTERKVRRRTSCRRI